MLSQNEEYTYRFNLENFPTGQWGETRVSTGQNEEFLETTMSVDVPLRESVETPINWKAGETSVSTWRLP